MKKLPKSEGVKQTTITFIGNIGSAGISALALILISRILGPKLFGEFSAGFAIIMILNKINDAGIAVAMQKYVGGSSNHTDAGEYLSISLRFKLTITILILLITLPFSNYLTNLFNFSSPYIVPISILLGTSIVYYEFLQSALQSLHLFSSAVIINATQASIKLIAAISIFTFHSKELLPIYTLFIAAPMVPLVLAKKLIPKSVTISLKNLSVKKTKQMVSIAKHSALLIIAAAVIDYIGILFVQRYLTSFETGLLGGVSRISLMFTLIGVSLAQVLNPRVARYKNKEDISTFIRKAFIIAGASILGFFVVIPFAKLSILLTIGNQYIQGYPVLIVLLASVFVYVASVPFSALFFSFKEPSYFSISGILQIITIVLGNFLFVPTYGLMATAWTQLVTRVITLVFTLIFALIAYKKEYSE